VKGTPAAILDNAAQLSQVHAGNFGQVVCVNQGRGKIGHPLAAAGCAAKPLSGWAQHPDITPLFIDHLHLSDQIISLFGRDFPLLIALLDEFYLLLEFNELVWHKVNPAYGW
jgi:hypothetical protein